MSSPNFLRSTRLMKATKFSATSPCMCSSPITEKSTNFSTFSSNYLETDIPLQASTRYTAIQPVHFASALALSSSTNNPLIGFATHAQIIKLGFSNDIFTNNNLVCMYSRCQLLNYALKLFCEMPQTNLVSWTSMISGCIRSDEHETGLAIYLEMMRSGFHPNEFALASVLSACAALDAIKLGNSFHAVSFKMGCERSSFLSSSLLFMYAKCGNIDAAELVFDCIEYPDFVCWNAMAESYSFCGYGFDAMRIVRLMHVKGFPVDKFTFFSALKACTVSENVNFGRQLHSLIIHHELESNTSMMNSLVDVYFRYEMTDLAMVVFHRIHEKDIVSWNTVFCGFAVTEDVNKVAALFSNMLHSGLKPNQVTFSAIFRLCGASENVCLGLQFSCFAHHLGFFHYPLVVNALINMFSKCGLMDKALFLFNSHGDSTTITYNEMIAGCNMNYHFTEALYIFKCLTKYGFRADEFTYTSVLSSCHGIQQQKIGEQIHARIIKSGFNSCGYICTSLINTYERIGSLRNSYKIFQGVEVRDLATWGAMISAFARQSFNNEAFSLLNFMRKFGANPDEFIFGSILNSCADNGVLNQCRCIHSLVIKTGYEMNCYLGSAAIDAYAKCGDIISSWMAFNGVSRDVILFNTMITAFAHHGMIMEAIEILEAMRRINMLPTQATFVAVLSACRHLGLVEEGQLVFDSISSVHGMVPSKDNYGCLVDLLARNGLFEKAKMVIESMPYEPWPAVWRSLLSGCGNYGKKEIAKLASEQLQLLQGDDGALVLLSNTYAEDGRWEEAENMRMRIVKQAVYKLPGFSVVGL
ncbi:pentatricopeptide repeat-containing protein At4g39530-like [Phalaenopsis equestris]|uniref:pentatricopeptide repeat-containing protein At4g39530-like n=1 Tax=Phalaenopsis equestris TaxID=78828 RepID=UPI0009E46269|nr:pentatricopeptide repeat-containing protein At4g39530-like [Phalaenopsis equestris]